MIKSSTLNFVRQKADEAKQLADLHGALSEIASRDRDIKEAKSRLDKLNADRAKAEADLKAVQQMVLTRNKDAGGVVAEAQRLKKEAEDIVAGAAKRADEMLAAARKGAADEIDKWKLSIDAYKQQLAGVRLDLAKADGDLESKKKEHAELESKHAALIAKHQSLLRTLAAAKSSL